ncbi:MAG: hypothetical protein GTN82_02755 [Candidatus Aminicenantes bacterium]|nr:hypothetical protein [Candidatus Aminicenantes bacterium]
MKSKTKSTIFRVLFVVLVILIFLVVKYHDCLIFEFSMTPEIFLKNKDKRNAVILYGSGICGSCPTGKRLLFLKDEYDLLLIVPEEFSDTDIENLRDVFSLKGKITRGNNELVDYLKKIASCKKSSDWRKNLFVEINENGRVSKLKKF